MLLRRGALQGMIWENNNEDSWGGCSYSWETNQAGRHCGLQPKPPCIISKWPESGPLLGDLWVSHFVPPLGTEGCFPQEFGIETSGLRSSSPDRPAGWCTRKQGHLQSRRKEQFEGATPPDSRLPLLFCSRATRLCHVILSMPTCMCSSYPHFTIQDFFASYQTNQCIFRLKKYLCSIAELPNVQDWKASSAFSPLLLAVAMVGNVTHPRRSVPVGFSQLLQFILKCKTYSSLYEPVLPSQNSITCKIKVIRSM